MGTKEKDAPYPRPRRPEHRRKSDGVEGVRNGRARVRNANKRRIAEGRRSTSREKVVRVEGGISGSDGGANRSDRVPVKRRAKVEVNAMIETCVEARPAGGLVTSK